jgi:hypothetical protein
MVSFGQEYNDKVFHVHIWLYSNAHPMKFRSFEILHLNEGGNVQGCKMGSNYNGKRFRGLFST